MTKITWIISLLECYPEMDGKQDVVFTVHWRANAEYETYRATVYGTCSVKLDPESPYTPYADLTEEQVLSWIWSSGVNKESCEASLEAQIQGQINPPVVTPPLPWINLNK